MRIAFYGSSLLSSYWNGAATYYRGLLRDLTHDSALRASLVAHGLETIRARHTCAHRAQELLSIAATLGLKQGASAA